MNSNQPHQSLKRGLQIIETLAAIGSSATLAEVARKTGLPRSTAYHLLRALVEFGYLVQDRDARTYTLACSRRGKALGYIRFSRSSDVSNYEKNNLGTIFNTISSIISSAMENIEHRVEAEMLLKLKNQKHLI